MTAYYYVALILQGGATIKYVKKRNKILDHTDLVLTGWNKYFLTIQHLHPALTDGHRTKRTILYIYIITI